MRKRVMTVMAGLLAVIIIAIICYRIFHVDDVIYMDDSDGEEMELTPGDLYSVNTLIGNADSQEEAERIAGLYGIELIEYGDGLALYETQEDPNEVIQRGEEEGYPQLWLNYNRTIE